MIEYADIDKDRELNRSELKIIAESLLSEKVRIDDLTSSGIRFLLNRLKSVFMITSKPRHSYIHDSSTPQGSIYLQRLESSPNQLFEP